MAVETRLPGNRRSTGAEQYYTPSQVADRLVGKLWTTLATELPGQDLAARTFVEPAGGTGAFVDALRRRGVARVLAVDIEPHHAAVDRADFLSWQPAGDGLATGGGAITLSNPPFGRNNKLSVRFFNHAAEFSDVIAFVVPQSWRKWSVINRLDPAFHLVSDEDLNVSYVDATGQTLSVHTHLRTAFQIWCRRDEPRARLVVQDRGLLQKTTPEHATHALTTFGYGCGRVSTEFGPTPKTTDIYLRIERADVAAALPRLDYQRFSKHTAYTEALSLPEINFLLNEYLTGDSGLQEVSWK